MSTESERLITALIDHAQAMQARSEAQQEQFESVLAALPQRVEAATRESVAAVVRAESQRLHAKATFIEGVARSATLRWGFIYAVTVLGLAALAILAGWLPEHQEIEELKQLRADEAALWSGIQQGQKNELISKCGTGKTSRLCVRIDGSARRYGEDSSYAVVWGH
jgi:predicted Fe-S protein YdhL (DUF1289 family)